MPSGAAVALVEMGSIGGTRRRCIPSKVMITINLKDRVLTKVTDLKTDDVALLQVGSKR